MIIFLLTLFTLSVILLIPTIMLQSNGANNGMMGSSAMSGAFGAKSNEILVRFTSYCVAVFIFSALLLSIHFIRANRAYEDTDALPQQVQTLDFTDELPEDGVALPISE